MYLTGSYSARAGHGSSKTETRILKHIINLFFMRGLQQTRILAGRYTTVVRLQHGVGAVLAYFVESL